MAFGFRAKTATPRDPQLRASRAGAGWRKLGFFWLTVLLLLAAGGGVVQYLGPPRAVSASVAQQMTPPGPKPAQEVAPAVAVASVAAVVPGRDTSGPIFDPDQALLEPAGTGSAEHLPRIAPDGRTARKFYAAGFDRTSHLPRVALVMGGIGLSQDESDAAIKTLPGAVSLAFSPYAPQPARLLAATRAAGHEYLVAIPLEPAGFPLNDPGPATLLTSASESVNAANLHWALSRIDGYAGVIGAIGTMRGERLAAMTDQMDAVLSDLAARGLFYVDPREGGGPVAKAWGRHVDLVIDETPDRTSIDAKLAELEQMGKDHGSALGFVMQPMPVAVTRVAAWANGLTGRGMMLVPASAQTLAPPDVKVTERDR
jgi:uncharacterized protein